MILIIIKFCELLLRISSRIINSLRSYIKHSKEGFLLFPNTSKLVKKSQLHLSRFSNLLLGVWTLFLVCLIYYISFQILLENMVIRFFCRTRQDMIITYFPFKFPGRGRLGFHGVIRFPNCFTQKNFCLMTIAATV